MSRLLMAAALAIAVGATACGSNDPDPHGHGGSTGGAGGNGGDGGTGGTGAEGGAGGSGGEGGAGGSGGEGGAGGSGGEGGAGGTGPVGPVITECATLEPVAAGACETTAGDGNLLLSGDVLVPGEVLRGGQVLIGTDGAILCAACDCTGEAAAAEATKVVCPDAAISPGLINAHDHITYAHLLPYTVPANDERYEHRHDWRRGKDGHTELDTPGGATADNIRWGELRFLMSGATSVNGSGSATGFLRNLDKADQEGLGQPAVDYDTFPLLDTSGTKITSGCGYSTSRTSAADIATKDAYTPHISEGIDAAARNEFLCSREGEFDLIQPQTAVIHGIGLTPMEIAEMGMDGSKLVWSPRSNITLYGDTARITEYASLGVRIALGTDWMPTGSSNMLRELSCADDFNQAQLGGFFTDEELWLMVTRNAAEALAVDDVLGVLAPGRIADVAIFAAHGHEDHRAVLDAEAQDVLLVLRGGKAIYGEAGVIEGLGRTDCDAIDVCGAAKLACVSTEAGKDLAALTAANAGKYPLFACGLPADEPTCVPSRGSAWSDNGSTTYTGVPTGDDLDGDGILNTVDNCATVFNPIRPMDNGVQADLDDDAVGDACDVCPLQADTEACAPPDPNDRDGDGLANDVDNCPGAPNADQTDVDDDGKGDVCDLCPNESNPGAAACSASIAEIQQGRFPAGSAVKFECAVTAVRKATRSLGFWCQDREGGPWSGIYVFTNTAPTVVPGDDVEVSGTYEEYYDLSEIGAPTVTKLGSGAVPEAEVVNPADIATTGTLGEAYESVLVKVENVAVTNVNPDGADDYDEFSVTGGLRVDDNVDESLDNTYALGTEFSSITGIGHDSFDNYKITPRGAADLVLE